MKRLQAIPWYILSLLVGFTTAISTSAAEPEELSAFQRAKQNLGFLEERVLGDEVPLEPEEIVARVLQIALGLIGLLFVVLMVYGGYLWMIARGNDEQVTRARNLIIQAVIGAVIVFLAYIITAFVVQRVGEAVFEPIFF